MPGAVMDVVERPFAAAGVATEFVAEPSDDSKKRRQIVEGAARAFLALGFKGASMGEIARIAGVSKGTLYVYFPSKEQLFEACMEAKRRAHFDRFSAFDEDAPVEAELTRFGATLASFLTTTELIMAMRTVIGIAEQMPELGARFYENGPARSSRIVAAYLDRKVAAGALAIPDTYLAAVQFSDMCQSTLVRPLLFGCEDVAARRPELIGKAVAAAVASFMRTYGVGR